MLVLYNKIRLSVTQHITINPPYNNECNEYQEKTTYGLYQYRTISIHIWIISIQDYTHNERVKRVLYTIYQQMKRYNHFNTTTHDKKCNAILLTSSPKMQHNTLPQDERTTTNNIFILQPTRERYTTDGTIPPYKTTSIEQDIILQDKRKHLYQRQRRIYLCRLICFLMHCNEEDKQSIKRTTDNDTGRY